MTDHNIAIVRPLIVPYYASHQLNLKRINASSKVLSQNYGEEITPESVECFKGDSDQPVFLFPDLSDEFSLWSISIEHFVRSVSK